MISRRCPRCSATFEPPSRFCVRCGVPLVELVAPAAADATAVRPPRLPDTGAVPLAPEESRRLSSLAGTMLDERYRIGRRIGEGGMSSVYEATEVGTERTVAIKVLPPRLARDRAAVERMRREADIAGRFDHPHVCPILRFGHTADGLLYLVMPYLQGETLNDLEVRTRKFPVDLGVRILVQLCHGLQHAHDRGIVHRDLKPENIMLVGPGLAASDLRAVVMDFGLAKERRAGAEVVKLTQTGIVLGTPEFMSPEQIRGRPLDGRSDIYALGVLAFEMFTGELPFRGGNAQEMMVARLKGLPRSMRSLRPDLPARLDSVVQRALALDPDDRWQSMTHLAAALERVTDGGPLARWMRRLTGRRG